jgi:hypothetical protein
VVLQLLLLQHEAEEDRLLHVPLGQVRLKTEKHITTVLKVLHLEKLTADYTIIWDCINSLHRNKIKHYVFELNYTFLTSNVHLTCRLSGYGILLSEWKSSVYNLYMVGHRQYNCILTIYFLHLIVPLFN